MTAGPPARVVALVPVKQLRDSKSRLGASVQAGARADLVLATLRTVLAALAAPAIVARVVVSPDPDVLAAARLAGGTALAQAGRGGDALNGALEQARDYALRGLPDAVLVVLGDLPLLGAEDIAAMLALARHERVAIIAPDRHGSGTNALLLRPPSLMPFAFGAASCQRHAALASQHHVVAKYFHAPGLAFDVDTPADLSELAARRPELARALALHGGSHPGHL